MVSPNGAVIKEIVTIQFINNMQKILTIIIVCFTIISCSPNRTVTLYGSKKISQRRFERMLEKDFDRTLKQEVEEIRLAKKLERQNSGK